MKFSSFIFFLISLNMMAQPTFEKAEKLFLEKKYALAKPIFITYLKDNPHHLKTLEYLGDIEGANKSWDEAMNYYGKLKQLKPSEANYFYKYGGCLGMKAKEVNKFKALGMIGEIKSSFEKAIQLNPKHLDARWALIQLYLELPGIVGGSEKKATKYANELVQLSPVDGYLAKGHIAEYFDRYKVAEEYYLKAHHIGNSKTTFQKLNNLYKKKQDKAQAQAQAP